MANTSFSICLLLLSLMLLLSILSIIVQYMVVDLELTGFVRR